MPTRTSWLDVCKGLGIVAVYYGHVVGRLGPFGVVEGLIQWVAIYAFHMPLFFVLSGYLHQRGNRSAIELLKRKIQRLVYPILFFNVLFALATVIIGMAIGQDPDWAWFAKALRSSVLTGAIRPCGLTWFLYCLMSVFVLDTILGRWATSAARALGLAAASGAFGYWMTLPEQQAGDAAAVLRIWFLDEAFVAYAFFLAGSVLRRCEDELLGAPSNTAWFLLALGSATVFLGTLGWNQGPFDPRMPGVVMALRSHGGSVFFLTALAGSIAFMCAARLIGRSRPLEWIGVNSIPFFALDAAFYGWVNEPLTRAWQASYGLPQSHGAVFLWAGLVGAASLLAAAPLVWLLGRVAPRASGASPPRGAGGGGGAKRNAAGPA